MKQGANSQTCRYIYGGRGRMVSHWNPNRKVANNKWNDTSCLLRRQSTSPLLSERAGEGKEGDTRNAQKASFLHSVVKWHISFLFFFFPQCISYQTKEQVFSLSLWYKYNNFQIITSPKQNTAKLLKTLLFIHILMYIFVNLSGMQNKWHLSSIARAPWWE